MFGFRRTSLLLLAGMVWLGCERSTPAPITAKPSAATSSPPGPVAIPASDRDALSATAEQTATPNQANVSFKSIRLLNETDVFQRNLSSEELGRFNKTMFQKIEQVAAQSPGSKFDLKVTVTLSPSDGHTVQLAYLGEAPEAAIKRLYAELGTLDFPATKTDRLSFEAIFAIGTVVESPESVVNQNGAGQSKQPPASEAEAIAKFVQTLEQLGANDRNSRERVGKATPVGDPVEALTNARRAGWTMAKVFTENLRSHSGDDFPGIQAWLANYDAAIKSLDLDQPPATWPPIDIDALVTHNPRFWQLYYEVVPGDPGLAVLYAALLQGCGELKRSSYVLVIARQRPGLSDLVSKYLDAALTLSVRAEEALNVAVVDATQLFDNGDFDGAARKLEESLAIWPQNSLAHFELGLTRGNQERIANGQTPLVANDKVRINEDPGFSNRVVELFATSRKHDPFAWRTYQGRDEKLIKSLRILVDIGMPIWAKMSKSRNADVPTKDLMMLAAVCQLTEIHELALVNVSLIIARRGRYAEEDHPFISKSLTALAPGPETQATLSRLAGSHFKACQILPHDASEFREPPQK